MSAHSVKCKRICFGGTDAAQELHLSLVFVLCSDDYWINSCQFVCMFSMTSFELCSRKMDGASGSGGA